MKPPEGLEDLVDLSSRKSPSDDSETSGGGTSSASPASSRKDSCTHVTASSSKTFKAGKGQGSTATDASDFQHLIQHSLLGTQEEGQSPLHKYEKLVITLKHNATSPEASIVPAPVVLGLSAADNTTESSEAEMEEELLPMEEDDKVPMDM